MALAPDDFTPGMFVTVLDTNVERPHPFAHAAGQETFEMKSYTGAGVVLEVVATSFPFILVRNHTTRMLPSPKVFPVDLRRTRLTRLNDEYVQAAVKSQPSQARLEAPAETPDEFPTTMRITGPFLNAAPSSDSDNPSNDSHSDNET